MTPREIAERFVYSSLDPAMNDTPSLRLRIQSTILKIEQALIQYGKEEREKALRELIPRIIQITNLSDYHEVDAYCIEIENRRVIQEILDCIEKDL